MEQNKFRGTTAKTEDDTNFQMSNTIAFDESARQKTVIQDLKTFVVDNEEKWGCNLNIIKKNDENTF